MRKSFAVLCLVLLALPFLAGALEPLPPPSQWCGTGLFKYPCPTDVQNAAGPIKAEQTFGGLVLQIIYIVMAVAGSVATVFLILGAFRYVTARGNEEEAETAKKTMTAAIWGLVIIFLAFAVISVIVNILISGESGTGT